ncbi:DUF4097 family beta strand repeat protein [Sphingobacterium sp. SG20118]|uniref:DUF4097 family beta strand repeat protein n=1 Tax=Sphingobacterium TaxID=28453 RepID=UPI0004F85C56|nr:MULTISPECIES: DUF4097 family beta strand repeat protein [Sphingobacterium]AIM35949.1 hypothetical protein KO02_04030 [Sphingobacterium sp. ML3W]MDH5827923.1 DUF4097 family beta strand repeat protein [Sphingobacterium faecium]
MKRFIQTTVLLLLVQVSFGQKMIRKETFQNNKIKDLEVSTSGGAIKVNGSDKESASVEIWISRNGNILGSSADLEKILNEHFDVTIQLEAGKLTASAKRKSGKSGNNPISVAFYVTVPESVNSNLKTAGGSIQLSALNGNQMFQTSGGSLQIRSLSGNITGKTSGGSINASNSQGDLQLNTSGGSITLDNCSGNIRVATSGGSINGKNLKGSIDAHTSGGSINMDMDTLSDDMVLATSGGSVRVKVPKGKYNINLKGSRVSLPSASNFSGTSKKTLAQGTINGGGKKIDARTSAGSVSLDFH